MDISNLSLLIIYAAACLKKPNRPERKKQQNEQHKNNLYVP